MLEKIKILKELIQKSKKIVFFGGAGVSTESGIPDFRSQDGLYNIKYHYPPEMIISATFFKKQPQEFYRFYFDKLLLPSNIQPNITHHFLAQLEAQGQLLAIITQNIDGLHQKAGSQNVIELHGSIVRNYCLKCQKFYSDILNLVVDGVPRCECGGLIKPDVVLYEESLNYQDLYQAQKALHAADLLIIGGTSLRVYPAAALIDYYQGSEIVMINRDETAQDHKATIIIKKSLGETFSSIKEVLK